MSRVSIEGNQVIDGESVPNDSDTDLRATSNGFYIGTEGDLQVQLENQKDGESITFVGLKAGIIYAIKADKVLASGTTADNILAVY